MIDPMNLAEMDKSKPLRARGSTREETCALCDGPISPDDWVVTIERGARAHTHCAADAGWEIL